MKSLLFDLRTLGISLTHSLQHSFIWLEGSRHSSNALSLKPFICLLCWDRVKCPSSRLRIQGAHSPSERPLSNQTACKAWDKVNGNRFFCEMAVKMLAWRLEEPLPEWPHTAAQKALASHHVDLFIALLECAHSVAAGFPQERARQKSHYLYDLILEVTLHH